MIVRVSIARCCSRRFLLGRARRLVGFARPRTGLESREILLSFIVTRLSPKLNGRTTQDCGNRGGAAVSANPADTAGTQLVEPELPAAETARSYNPADGRRMR